MKKISREFLASIIFFGTIVSFVAAEEVPPSPGKPPLQVFEISPQPQNIAWIFDNAKRNLSLLNIDSNPFISITDLARISEAQLGWQAVTQQACLSKIENLMCFNWGDSSIYVNGSAVSPKYTVRFVDNKLYVAFPFVTSKYFKKFSGTDFEFNETKKELAQKIPVNLEIPAIQNMGDRYHLSLNVDSENDFHVLKQEKDSIWLRFPGGQTSGSSVMEGDNIIREIKIIQKRHSADMMVKLGGASSSYELRFDADEKKLNLDVFLREPVAVENSAAKAPSDNDSQAISNLILPPLPAAAKVNSGPTTSIPTPPPAQLPKATVARRTEAVAGTEKGIKTIVIDAGHGGFDSGAMGVRGTFEKDINLRVAEELAAKLKKEKNLRVVMTRETDIFLPLEERTKIANEVRADLFVSIHCNSSISAKHTGFEVYLLAGEASDEAAAAVARFENSVVALESKKGEKSEKLSGLLASMAVNTYINDSSELAAMICRGAKKTTAVKESAVKEANFYVLRGAQSPSVLIELDYLSNPISELKLRSSRFTTIVAKGIAQGIQDFDDRARKKEELMSARSSQQRSTPPQ